MADFKDLPGYTDRNAIDEIAVARGLDPDTGEVGMMNLSVIGGVSLGPETNEFTGANQSAAETSRNTYAAGNAAWLTQYNDNLNFLIVLTYGTTVVYQRRNAAGSAWENAQGLIRGAPGDEGPQARFLVYAYINTATALRQRRQAAPSYKVPTCSPSLRDTR